MEKNTKLRMAGLLALVIAMGTVAMAQNVAYSTVTVTNLLNVGGELVPGSVRITPTPGEPPILIPYDSSKGAEYPVISGRPDSDFSLLFTRSVIVEEVFTNKVTGQVTADNNGDVELTPVTAQKIVRKYSIYAEKIIDNNTLQDIVFTPPPLGADPRSTIEYRAGAGGTSGDVGTLLRDTSGNFITVSRPVATDETTWRIIVDDLSTTAPYSHKSLVVTTNILPSSGGNLQVGGDANVDGDVTVGGNLTVDGVSVPDAIADTSADVVAVADMSAVNTAALSSELAVLSEQVNGAQEEADAPVASAEETVLTGDVVPSVSGFVGDNYVLKWTSSANVEYQIQSSDDMQAWETIGETLTGTGAMQTWANAVTNSQCFYRVIVLD